jgi:hypothetical protein
LKSLVISALAVLISATAAAGDVRPPAIVIIPSAGIERRAEFITRLGDTFDRLDVHKNEYLTRASLRAVFSAPMLKLADPVPFSLKAVEFSCLDANHDGKLSRLEYLNFGTTVFDAVDVAHSGLIDHANTLQTIEFLQRVRASGIDCNR